MYGYKGIVIADTDNQLIAGVVQNPRTDPAEESENTFRGSALS